MTRHLLYLGLVFLLASCTTTKPVFLTHPKTGATVQCGPYPTRGLAKPMAAAMHETQCIQDYKEQGYVRVPSPK